MKIDDGRAMAVSSKNFDAGMILPRATPARSGTRHSISVTPRAIDQARASATLVTTSGSAAVFFFLAMMFWGGRAALLRRHARLQIDQPPLSCLTSLKAQA